MLGYFFWGDEVKGLGALLTTAPKRLKKTPKNDELSFGPNPNSILAI